MFCMIEQYYKNVYIHTCMYQYRSCNSFTKIKEYCILRHRKGRATHGSSPARKSHPLVIIGKKEPPTGHHRKGKVTHGSSSQRKRHTRIIIGKKEQPLDHHRKFRVTNESPSERKSHPWIIIRMEEPPMVHHQKGRATHGSSSNRKTYPLIITGQEELVMDWTYIVHINDNTRCYSPVNKKDCFKFGILSGLVFF